MIFDTMNKFWRINTLLSIQIILPLMMTSMCIFLYQVLRNIIVEPIVKCQILKKKTSTFDLDCIHHAKHNNYPGYIII